MTMYLGDFPTSHTAVCIPFDSFAAATGASSATSSFVAGDVLVYKDGGTTQRTSSSGIVASTSFDSQTGLQMITIDLSDNTDAGFYAAGHEYQVGVADVTIDGQTVRFWAATFSIERAGGVLALIKANTIKVDVNTIKTQSVTCAAGVTVLASVGTAATSTAQTGDNFARLGAPAGASVSADVAAVKAVLPSALVSGRIDASVGAMASGVLTATAIAADAITAAKVADGTIDAATFAAGAINAAAIAADAITDAKVASDVTIASVTGAVGSVTARVTANTDQLAGQTVTAAAGVTFPASVASPTNITAGTITTTTNLTNAPTAGDFTSTMKTSIGTAVAASAVASVTGAVGSVTGLTASDVGAIKAKTDNLPSDPADESLIIAATDAIYGRIGAPAGASIADDISNISGGSAPSAATVADAVWDELLSGHVISGSAGEALSGAGAAGDPWIATIEGSLNARDVMRVLAAVAAGKTSIVKTSNGHATVTFRDITDASDIIAASMAQSERTGVTVTP